MKREREREREIKSKMGKIEIAQNIRKNGKRKTEKMKETKGKRTG